MAASKDPPKLSTRGRLESIPTAVPRLTAPPPPVPLQTCGLGYCAALGSPQPAGFYGPYHSTLKLPARPLNDWGQQQLVLPLCFGSKESIAGDSLSVQRRQRQSDRYLERRRAPSEAPLGSRSASSVTSDPTTSAWDCRRRCSPSTHRGFSHRDWPSAP